MNIVGVAALSLPHVVVSALRDKRAEISGMIADLEKELSRRRADLAHLDATLRLFAPDLAPHSIKPRRRTGRNAWFRSCGDQRALQPAA